MMNRLLLGAGATVGAFALMKVGDKLVDDARKEGRPRPPFDGEKLAITGLALGALYAISQGDRRDAAVVVFTPLCALFGVTALGIGGPVGGAPFILMSGLAIRALVKE